MDPTEPVALCCVCGRGKLVVKTPSEPRGEPGTFGAFALRDEANHGCLERTNSAGLHLDRRSSLPWSNAFVVTNKEEVEQCPTCPSLHLASSRSEAARGDVVDWWLSRDWHPTIWHRHAFGCSCLVGGPMPSQHHIAADTHGSQFCLGLARE